MNPPFRVETPDQLNVTRRNFGSRGRESLPLNEQLVGFMGVVAGTPFRWGFSVKVDCGQGEPRSPEKSGVTINAHRGRNR